MISKKWVAPLVLMLALAGSLSACSSDGTTDATSGPGGSTESVAAQGQDSESTGSFDMTISGVVEAHLTEADLKYGMPFCPDFQAEYLDGSTATVDTYEIDFALTMDGEDWHLSVYLPGGAPGTVPVASSPTGASVRLSGSYPNMWMPSLHDPVSSGSVTISEDGQSGTLNAKDLGGNEGGENKVSIVGSWAC